MWREHVEEEEVMLSELAEWHKDWRVTTHAASWKPVCAFDHSPLGGAVKALKACAGLQWASERMGGAESAFSRRFAEGGRQGNEKEIVRGRL